MNSKKVEKYTSALSEEAMHVLKISGIGKNPDDTYNRAKATLAMLDISVRMLISEMEKAKATQL